MLEKGIEEILSGSKQNGWIMEPEAKRLLSLAGLEVPKFTWATGIEEALRFSMEIGYPVVAKVVSPKVIHKSDLGGVVSGIDSDEKLREAYSRFSRLDGFAGVLVEETLAGVELIIGAKMAYQFGPVILLGMGGTGVEIYGDTTLRMAPLSEADVVSAVRGLRAHRLLEGYRGSDPISLDRLTEMLLSFSNLVMKLEDRFESIDLNPVICSPHRCVVADARIMLVANPSPSRQ